MSARFPAFSMISSASRTISGLRRASTPNAPIAKSTTDDDEVGRDSGSEHRVLLDLVAVAAESSRRGSTPPTAATSRTIEVTSNASR